ncbi:S41 family peptidase [Paenibacillus oralis]|uniref:S41 family peptidase n=1 Tax=Paenibacillus oralis TaxID=2490856 RepID=A0A3P3TUX2_9BACL|nr:S41 family peptidase [Paenibacillus oralis]RRJ61925.1 S41 family peptidase [Paenibacillus oralis]
MKKNHFRKYAIIPLLALSLLGLPQAAGAAESSAVTNEAGEAAANSDLVVLEEVLDLLDAYNIEGVEREQFLENAIRGAVYSLDDPYSDYFTEEELQSFEEGLNQEYVGIGATLRYTGDKLYITDVLEGSPAATAGLKQSDIITLVDGQAVTGGEDIARIQGQENTIVNITVSRNGQKLNFPIKRAHFALPSVTGMLIPSSKVGYIAISSFSENADDEFAAELSSLREQGIGALVLDLRDNLGGYVEAAANIAKHFMKEGVLMYTADQSGTLQPYTIEGGENIGMPVVVLTNEMTASASEILTGALRDNGIAKVVGTHTYGKARIQNLFTLSNGGSLKLTVQRYLTPKQEDFNHVGLKPDIEVGGSAPAQLITGLYQAGVRKIELSGSPASLTINGASFAGFVDVLEDDGKIYAPARILAALVQGEPAWNAGAQKLTITDGSGKTIGFSKASKSVKVVYGESYVELHDFQQKYPALVWSYKQGILQLSVKS